MAIEFEIWRNEPQTIPIRHVGEGADMKENALNITGLIGDIYKINYKQCRSEQTDVNYGGFYSSYCMSRLRFYNMLWPFYWWSCEIVSCTFHKKSVNKNKYTGRTNTGLFLSNYFNLSVLSFIIDIDVLWKNIIFWYIYNIYNCFYTSNGAV